MALWNITLYYWRPLKPNHILREIPGTLSSITKGPWRSPFMTLYMASQLINLVMDVPYHSCHLLSLGVDTLIIDVFIPILIPHLSRSGHLTGYSQDMRSAFNKNHGYLFSPVVTHWPKKILRKSWRLSIFEWGFFKKRFAREMLIWTQLPTHLLIFCYYILDYLVSFHKFYWCKR